MSRLSVVVALALVAYAKDGDGVPPTDLEQDDIAGAAEGNDQFTKEWAMPPVSGLSTGERKLLQHDHCLFDCIERLASRGEVPLQQEVVEPIEVLLGLRGEPNAIAHRARRPLPAAALRA